MVKEAIIHQAESNMCYLTDDGNTVIILKAKKGDLSNVLLIYDDRYDSDPRQEAVRIPLTKMMSDELYDYFYTKFKCRYTRMCYYFSLMDQSGNHIYLYQDGFSDGYSWGRQRLFHFPYLHRKDTPHVPAWLKESVMYQIFPDSFANGRHQMIERPARHVLEDGTVVESRLGGTLRGIMENIPYLKDLGISLLYLNPIFTANSYHKYDTVDYYSVDPCLGTLQDLKDLVDACHQNGIRVMLDLVFNQSGNQFFAFKDVIKNGKASRYAGWYHIKDYPVKGGKNPNYETFGFYDSMPKFNTDNPEVEDYLMDIARYWIKECDIDGYRLDVANELPHEFWRRLRREVCRLKPDFALIGEVWHHANAWIGCDQFHSVMNYPLMHALWEFFGLNSINAHQFGERVNRMTMLYPWDHTQAMMNFLDTHDVMRFFTLANRNEDRQKMAAAFLFTYVGVPSVYYGDEKAIEGTDINDSRRKMIWQDDERSSSVHDFFRRLISMRRENKTLVYGEYRPLVMDICSNLFGFMRFTEEDRILCVFNNNPNENAVSLPFEAGIYEDLLTGECFDGKTGCLNFTIPPYGVRILKTI